MNINEKMVLLYFKILPQCGKDKAFWENTLKSVAKICFAEILADVLQYIRLQIFHLVIIQYTNPLDCMWITRIREQSGIPIMVMADTMQVQEALIMAGADAVLHMGSGKTEIILQAYALIRRYDMRYKGIKK